MLSARWPGAVEPAEHFLPAQLRPRDLTSPVGRRGDGVRPLGTSGPERREVEALVVDDQSHHARSTPRTLHIVRSNSAAHKSGGPGRPSPSCNGTFDSPIRFIIP